MATFQFPLYCLSSCDLRSSRIHSRPSGPGVGGLSLAVVLDLFSRRVIGWAMAAMQDGAHIETALRVALLGEADSRSRAGTLHWAMSARLPMSKWGGSPKLSGFHKSGSASGVDFLDLCHDDPLPDLIEYISALGTLSNRGRLTAFLKF